MKIGMGEEVAHINRCSGTLPGPVLRSDPDVLREQIWCWDIKLEQRVCKAITLSPIQ